MKSFLTLLIDNISIFALPATKMIPVAFAGDISDSWSLSYYVCQSLDVCTDEILFQIIGIVWTIRLLILLRTALR